MRRLVTQFMANAAAATSIEYALIGTLVSIAIIAGAMALGTSLNVVFTNLNNSVVAASSTG